VVIDPREISRRDGLHALALMGDLVPHVSPEGLYKNYGLMAMRGGVMDHALSHAPMLAPLPQRAPGLRLWLPQAAPIPS